MQRTYLTEKNIKTRILRGALPIHIRGAIWEPYGCHIFYGYHNFFMDPTIFFMDPINLFMDPTIMFMDPTIICGFYKIESRGSHTNFYGFHPVPEAGLRLKKYSEAETCHF